ncbi:hypothetical protein [Blastococcus goldschmidtiae]|uniref:RiboL-PSP-HEPN domain-containing protein n=1 Tax=Blastococcus goldschmidtiae TaxID=3075546 RepID=A0ABU2K8Y5_9ACTN|nr:hypothetical protein [Blastococcus sp. DSM 46792]MDT0276655.1 hypothetical protein [Blastococcus sp. DSM 46792]
MTSNALRSWEGERRARLNELYIAHTTVGGSGPGRRTATEQLNWSLAIRLAGEFQGFARDLHDEALDALLDHVGTPTPAAQRIIRNQFTLNRQLDKGNATPSALQQDFLRLGFKLLDDLKSSYRRAESWLKALENLNDARNGIAHSDSSKIAKATGTGRLQLQQVKGWDASMRMTARAIDVVTSRNIATITAGGPPW